MIEAFLTLTSSPDIQSKKQHSVPTMEGKLAVLVLLRSNIWSPM